MFRTMERETERPASLWARATSTECSKHGNSESRSGSRYRTCSIWSAGGRSRHPSCCSKCVRYATASVWNEWGFSLLDMTTCSWSTVSVLCCAQGKIPVDMIPRTLRAGDLIGKVRVHSLFFFVRVYAGMQPSRSTDKRCPIKTAPDMSVRAVGLQCNGTLRLIWKVKNKLSQDARRAALWNCRYIIS